MEAVIRWSPRSTPENQRFIILNLAGRNAKLCEVESTSKRSVQYKQLSQHTKVPLFRAFDWSPVDEGLVGVGLPSGEATILRIDDNSNDTWSFPVKHQRGCNSVAFSSKGLLAAGLDKVRNDFCLNIWDINQRAVSAPSPRISSPASPRTQLSSPTPVRQLSSSEGITSVRFFYDQPETLVAGVKGQFLRIYDLRDSSGSAALQFPTRYVHYLAIDPLDDNHFASAGSAGDATICIWDRRAGPRLTAASLSSGNTVTDGLSVELKNVIDTRHNSNIWSVRYSRSKRGALGILSTSGQFRVYETVADTAFQPQNAATSSPSRLDTAPVGPELLRTKYVRDIERPFFDQESSQDENHRIVSFDSVNLLHPTEGHQFITLGAERTVQFYSLPKPCPPVFLLPRGSVAVGKSNLEQSSAPEDPLQSSKPDVTFFEPPEFEEPISNTIKKIKDSEPGNSLNTQLGNMALGLAMDMNAKMEKATNGLISPDRTRIEEYLTLRTVMRRRCEEGYLFNCRLNQRIVAEDSVLQNLWAWIQDAENLVLDKGMVFNGLDLSYLGVHGIWNEDLGSNRQARLAPGAKYIPGMFQDALKSCNEQHDREPFMSVQTAYPDHRQLCLAICGRSMAPDQVEEAVKALVKQNKLTEAAALAVFQGQPKHGIMALYNGNDSHKLLAMGIAGFHNIGGVPKSGNDSEWTELCKSIARSLTDPYSRAILALVSEGDWASVVEESSLPLRDRLGVALRYFDDDDLTLFINKTLKRVIVKGSIEGIVLTGLTERGNDLLHQYAVRNADPQTAVLAMAYSNPRYVTDPRFEHWREFYRTMMDTWKLHIQRARFDVGSTKKSRTSDGKVLLPILPRQVTLRCNYCSRSLAMSDDADKASANASNGTSKTMNDPLNRAGKSGTVCPKCKRHLPRCGVCMTWLGLPDATTPGGAAAAESKDPLQHFTNFCMSCNHGFHALHARDWFARHKMCPIADCQCLCARFE